MGPDRACWVATVRGCLPVYDLDLSSLLNAEQTHRDQYRNEPMQPQQAFDSIPQQEHLSRPRAQITKSPLDQCVRPSNDVQ